MKEHLEALAKRFDEMATVMRDNADGKRPYAYKREDIAMFNGAALAYRICANQVRRVAAGGTPPPPDMRWDYPEDET